MRAQMLTDYLTLTDYILPDWQGSSWKREQHQTA